MGTLRQSSRTLFAAIGLVAIATFAQAQTATPNSTPAIPKGKETDIKFYPPNGGKPVTGGDAFEQMPKASLILWLAGNQFFAMDDVVSAYQNQHPGTSVGLITLPPGLLLQAIKAGGWTYAGKDYRGLPDVYASVNLGHLKQLKTSGMMDSYSVYMHNELQIMVAKGNPKKITGVQDLARADVRTSMPNPINEGIMQFYIRKVLERHGIWQTISGGKECVHCQVTPTSWFTAVHHRETPDRILANQSDAGMVWKTEVLAAERAGAKIDAVALPDQDSLRKEVSYVIGMLKAAPHSKDAQAFLTFLSSAECQQTYAKYGFVNASADELKPRPIE
jgi:ABC-type molybdate transport system substrate-binding protein